MIIKSKYKEQTEVNKDDTTEAVHGLDIFTKNWCMNVKETVENNEPTFRCQHCEFLHNDCECLIKIFTQKHEHNYPMKHFGSMAR